MKMKCNSICGERESETGTSKLCLVEWSNE